MSAVPEVVAVIGGGRMGAGIAQVFATAGASVTIAEASDDADDQGKDGQMDQANSANVTIGNAGGGICHGAALS